MHVSTALINSFLLGLAISSGAAVVMGEIPDAIVPWLGEAIDVVSTQT